jgi:hypothetical protein
LLSHRFVTHLSPANVLSTIVAKLCAALLVALVILPNTAPFCTLVVADSPASRHAVIGTTAHASVADPDDDDALVLERSHVLFQSHLWALMSVASCEAAVVIGLFRPALAPTTFIRSVSPLKPILRV